MNELKRFLTEMVWGIDHFIPFMWGTTVALIVAHYVLRGT